jgi:hypothetical protein
LASAIRVRKSGVSVEKPGLAIVRDVEKTEGEGERRKVAGLL